MMAFMLAALSASCLPSTSNPRPLQQQQQQQRQEVMAEAPDAVSFARHPVLRLNCFQSCKHSSHVLQLLPGTPAAACGVQHSSSWLLGPLRRRSCMCLLLSGLLAALAAQRAPVRCALTCQTVLTVGMP
jgi:hypothetical protein